MFRGNPTRKKRREDRWSPHEECLIKINVNASRTIIGYIMRGNKEKVIMASEKSLGDCSILVTECEAVSQAIDMTIKSNIPRVCIYSDSHMVVNAIRIL